MRVPWRNPCLSLAFLTGLSGAAFAASQGYYHPDDVAAQSARFAEATSSVGPAWDKAQAAASRTGKALGDLELGVALLGDAAPQGFADRAQATRKEVTGQFMRLQRHVDLLQDDYAQTFQAALDRALARQGQGLTQCAPPRGGMAARFGPGGGGASAAACAGEDRNAALAKAIDADPELTRALAEIASVPWPTIEAPSRAEPVVPLTGDRDWIQAAPVARALIGDLIMTRQEALEDAMAPLEDGLEASDPAAIARAAEMREAWERDLAADGAALRTALADALARAAKKTPELAAVGLCANPPALGGCAGVDRTELALPILHADPKLARALAKLGQ